ncbi:probable cinnamyl alcohol dehydrogenase 5 [Triticum dicoccoides]|uniref:probable cinnamyl alcohol dehydrogenase 5 n=1 Tax=Triticum dicoccoides TaxID=85692 RepID=UPI000E7CBC77|nr:probable cinnamyl alcohol dehydrogenase 5 [Triticum dicoccoides]
MAPTATAAEQSQQHTKKAVGLAALDASGHLSPLAITRRSTGDDDVVIKILYCGICHSDLHSIKNDWKNAKYPMIPGHEIAGEVTEVGKNVTKFKAGDRVGVGCMVNSCQSCESCDKGFENHCPGMIFTYNSVDRDGTRTHGGYSSMVVVHERFVVRFPDAMPLDKGAPLLCAGITVYSPMKYHGLNAPGMHLGVLGLGGLGHVAVKFGKAFGMKVTVISSSPGKKQEALEKLGADAFVVSKDADEMKATMSTMDGIINTVSANVPMAPLFGLLKPNGKMIMVGLPEKPIEVPPFALVARNKTLAGSCIGGMRDTQEMLDLAAKHGVTADIEVIGAEYVNTAMERLAKADVRYRFVIDIANTLDKAAAATTE